jgi:hypothetical protein
MLDRHRRLRRSRLKCKECTEPRGRAGRLKTAGVLRVEHMGRPKARRFELRFSARFSLRFFRTDDEMDHAVGCGNEEAIEVIAQLLDLVAPCNAMHFQK